MMAIKIQIHYIRQILKLAVPLMIANISMIGMGVVDTIMAGQAGAEDLAGLAIGGNVWLIFEMTMWGIICAIQPRVARFYGAKESAEITQESQQGLMLAAFLGGISTIAILLFIPVVNHLGTDPEVTYIAKEYLQVIAFSLPISGLCWAVFAILEGHSMMRFVVWSSLVAVILNIIFDYIFVFGKLGAPAMGGVGCAWTTTIIYWLWGVSALVYLAKQKSLKSYSIFSSWTGVKLIRWRAICALGLPISLAILAEEGFFNITALMIAPLGTQALGAHQITITIVAIVGMVGFGVGQATAIVVAQSIGRKSYTDVNTQLGAGVVMILSFGVTIGLCVFASRGVLPTLFTADSSIAVISSAIMVFAPIYLVLDVLLVWVAQSLRGFEDTKIPMLLLFVAYWLIGFPMGYSLALTEFWGQSYDIYGFWFGLFAGISLGCALMCTRLYTKSRHFYKCN